MISEPFRFTGVGRLAWILGLILLVWMGMGWRFSAHAATVNPNNSATQQLILDYPPAQVWQQAQAAFKRWPRGEFVRASMSDESKGEGEVIGLSRTKVFKFVDDIQVTIKPVAGDPQRSQVTLVSVGRMGEYDFGGNQRNLQEYLNVLTPLLTPSL